MADRRYTSTLRRGVSALAAISLIIAAVTIPSALSVTASASPLVKFATVQPLCPPATATTVTCFALKRVDVAAGTPGARAYTASPAANSGANGGFSPANLATAYGVNPDNALGATQTVGIVDAYSDPNILSDVAAFDAHYGLPAETADSLRVVNQDGLAGPLPPSDVGWAGEIALDVEAVRGMCHLCRIVLVETTSNANGNLAAGVATAVALGATEVSNSYGSPENSFTTSQYASSYDRPGVVVTVSTGDDGWYGWDYMNAVSGSGQGDGAAEYPSTLPTVIAVGGTSLSINPDGSRASESVWNRNGLDDVAGYDANNVFHGSFAATGGGCSAYTTATSWQQSVAGWAHTGCGTSRLAADVSALGDPYTGFDIYDTFGGTGWETTGGTSLSSPLMSAMWALAGGSRGVAYPAQTLYSNYAASAASAYDVQSGGNSFCGGDSAANCQQVVLAHTANATGNPNDLATTAGPVGTVDCSFSTSGPLTVLTDNSQCQARTGFDGPSGVGTPKGLSLLTAPLAVPIAPWGITGTARDSAAVISWHAPTSNGGAAIDSYEVTSDPDAKTCQTTVTLTCSVLGLTNDTQYAFTVRAHNSVGWSAPSDISASIAPHAPIPPDPPTSVTGVAGVESVAVSWQVPGIEGDASIDGYDVTASPGGKQCTTTGDLTCTVTNLTNGTAYSFIVRAHSAVGWSLASTPSDPVSPVPPTVPDPPDSVTGAPTIGAIEVSWNAPASDGGAVVDSYQATADPGGVQCSTTNGTQCTLQGLSSAQTYTVTVKAHNSVGWSSASAPSDSITPLDPTVPDAPSSVTGLPGNSSATISWQPPASDGGASVSSYAVTADHGGQGCTTSGPTHCTVIGLINGSPYTFTVTAHNSVGDSSPSDASAPIVPRTSPGSVRSIAIRFPARGAARVTFSPPAPNGAATTTWWRLSSNAGSTWTPWGTGISGLTIPHLSLGHRYLVQLQGRNSAGSGPTSASLFTIPTLPGLVRSLAASARTRTGLIRVTWRTPASNGGAPVTAYLYRVSVNSGRTFGPWIRTNTATASIRARARTAYAISVAAINVEGVGTASTIRRTT